MYVYIQLIIKMAHPVSIGSQMGVVHLNVL